MVQQESQQISSRDAIRIAREYMKSLYEGETLLNLMLEEVDFSDETNRWLITFGYDVENPEVEHPSLNALGVLQKPTLRQFVRYYKLIEVDAETGKALSLKIRTIGSGGE